MSINFEMNIMEGKNQYFQTDKGNILEVYHDTSFPNPKAAGLTCATRISGRYHSEAYKMAELNMASSPEIPTAQLSAVDRMLLRPELSDPSWIPTKTDELRALTGVNTPKLNISVHELQERVNAYIDAHADEFSPGAKYIRSLDELLNFCEDNGIRTDDMLLLREVPEGKNIVLYIYDNDAFKSETGMDLVDAPKELKAAVMDEAIKMYQAYKEGQVFSCNLYNAKGQHMAEHRGFFGNNIEENGMLSCIPENIARDMGQMPNISIAKFRALRDNTPEVKSLSELIGMASGDNNEKSATATAKDVDAR